MQTDHGCLIETSSPIALPAKMPWYLRLKQSKCVKGCIIISEILDSRTRHLINELNISEYVMSNEIISMALAMVSENASVNQVLRELFTEVRPTDGLHIAPPQLNCPAAHAGKAGVVPV